MKQIIPRECLVRGEKRWRVIVPKDLRGNGQAFFFYDDPEEAQKKADELTADRFAAGAEFHGLNQKDQALLLEALKRAKGSASMVLAAVDEANTKQSAASPKLIASVVEEFVSGKKAAGVRNASYKNLKSSTGKFSAAMPVAMIHEVTPKHIEDWLANAGWKPRSRKTYLGHVVMLFEFAKRRGYVASNPAQHISRPRTEDAPPGIHTVKQVETILQWCLKNDKPLVGYLAPIYFGGLRPNESAQLKKEEIHDNLVEVTPAKSKTRRRRFIEINPTLKRWLGVKKARLGGKWSSITLRRHLRKLKEATGGKDAWPHDVLRHTFCSYALPKYGATKTAEWAGHSEQILFAHYRERVKPSDAEKFWALRP